MSNEEPPPLAPWITPAIIFAVDLVTLVILGALGVLERLSPTAQFYFGATTLGFPLIVYLVLKQRQNQ